MRSTLLDDLKPTFERSPYINPIKNPETRLIFTRLRIDMNVFSDYMKKKYIGTATCPICHRGPHPSLHILAFSSIFCCIFLILKRSVREKLYQNIELQQPRWQHMDDDMKLKFILDLKCPNVIGSCCSYVHLHITGKMCCEAMILYTQENDLVALYIVMCNVVGLKCSNVTGGWGPYIYYYIYT